MATLLPHILRGVRRLLPRLLLLLALTHASAGAPRRRPAKALKPAKAAPAAPKNDVERLERAWQRFGDGDYAETRDLLAKIDMAKLHNRDYATYLLAQSELLLGDAASARAHFGDASLKRGRFQLLARWRAAD